MSNAWVVRPKPHGKNRITEFLEQEIAAVGWPTYGNLAGKSKSEIRGIIQKVSGHEGIKLGQLTGQLDRFVNSITPGDVALVPSGSNIYVGTVESDYRFVEKLASDGYGYPHQRDVSWIHEGKAIERGVLPGKLHDTLKCQLTVFSADFDQVEEVLDAQAVDVDEDHHLKLKEAYLDRLTSGNLHGMIDRRFEEAVRIVLSEHYPALQNVSGKVDAEGDTDLLADGPGDVTIRVQVKHYYQDRGELGSGPVEQLAASMDEGDCGIVVTPTEIGDEARQAAKKSRHQIGFIGGEKFVDLLFENPDGFTSEELNALGLQREIRGIAF